MKQKNYFASSVQQATAWNQLITKSKAHKNRHIHQIHVFFLNDILVLICLVTYN